MNSYLKISLTILGIIFLGLGFVGLFIPIMQGILFLVIGTYILSISSARFKKSSDHLIGRFPKIKHHYDKHKGRVDKLFKKRGDGNSV